MKPSGWTAIAAAALLIAVPIIARGEKGAGHGRAIVTVLAKHNEISPNISATDVSAKVNGKDAAVSNWAPFKSGDNALELVFMIDGGARNLGRQFQEIQEFVQGMGPQAKITIAYMENGRAVMAGPLTADHQQAMRELHLPAGPSTNPYFSLSDLAQRWPSQDRNARREVILLSDGVDPNNRHYDPDDPYVQTAIHDCVRAGLVIYAVYWRDHFQAEEGPMVADGGQSLLRALTDATGGNSYWTGFDNPVSFRPYFDDIVRRFASQYELDFAAPIGKPEIENLKLKVAGLSLQVTAPQQVYVTPDPK